MIGVIATLQAKPGQGDRLAAALERAAPLVRSNEPGCSFYQPIRAQENPDVIKVFEIYDSAEAIAAHRETAHFQPLKEAFGALLAAPPTVERFDVFG